MNGTCGFRVYWNLKCCLCASKPRKFVYANFLYKKRCIKQIEQKKGELGCTMRMCTPLVRIYSSALWKWHCENGTKNDKKFPALMKWFSPGWVLKSSAVCTHECHYNSKFKCYFCKKLAPPLYEFFLIFHSRLFKLKNLVHLKV